MILCSSQVVVKMLGIEYTYLIEKLMNNNANNISKRYKQVNAACVNIEYKEVVDDVSV